MAAIKRDITGAGARAFAAGVRQGSSSVPTRAERDAERVADAERQRDVAKAKAQEATLGANALAFAVDHGVTDPLARRRVQNTVVAAHERARRAGEKFDYHHEVRKAVHAVKPAPVAPVDPRGAAVHPGGRTAPMTFHDVQRDREAYRQRLRELGLTDPAHGSYPGDGRR